MASIVLRLLPLRLFSNSINRPSLVPIMIRFRFGVILVKVSLSWMRQIDFLWSNLLIFYEIFIPLLLFWRGIIALIFRRFGLFQNIFFLFGNVFFLSNSVGWRFSLSIWNLISALSIAVFNVVCFFIWNSLFIDFCNQVWGFVSFYQVFICLLVLNVATSVFKV